MHHVSPRVLVSLVDQYAADSTLRHWYGKSGVNGVILGVVALLLIGEFQGLTRSRVVYFEVRSLTAAASGIDQFGRSRPVLFRQEANTKLLGAGVEDGVFGVGVLTKETAHRR